MSVFNTAPRDPARRFCFVPPASCRRSFLFVAQAAACALFIPRLNSKETAMASLSAKDRVSLCSFTFSDGRRCRTPHIAKHLRFCSYHAQKETRARTARILGKDLPYFFSGDYLSASDLTAALPR